MAKSSKPHAPFYRRSFLVVPYSKKTSLEEDRHYNDQLRWQLRSIAPTSHPEALRLLREFGRVAHEASEKFHWATTYLEKSDKWCIRVNFRRWDVKRHGWKHVSFKDLIGNARKVRHGDAKTALRQTVFRLAPGEFEVLVRNASQSKPVEVAHLWYLCKSKKNIGRVLREFYRWAVPAVSTKELLAKIPSPIELAVRYVEAIYECPSRRSDKQRQCLEDLVSAGAIQNAGKDDYRPTIIYSWADVVFVRAMSYSFVKQVNHARSFLEGAKFYDRDERARMSLDCLGVDESLHFWEQTSPSRIS